METGGVCPPLVGGGGSSCPLPQTGPCGAVSAGGRLTGLPPLCSHGPAHQRRAALTCCVVALEADDAHPLEAGAALFAPGIDQGEVSVRVPGFL